MIYGVNAAYAHGYAVSQIDFLSGLPVSIATAIGGAVPFLQPYTEFVVNYLATFVEALQRLFGMGSNGYMVTIAFAYIGGIVADQARREIGDKEGASTRVNIVQPIVERLHLSERDGDERLVRGRQPSAHHARGHPVPLSEYRKVPAQVLSSRRALPPPRRRPQARRTGGSAPWCPTGRHAPDNRTSRDGRRLRIPASQWHQYRQRPAFAPRPGLCL